MAGEKSRICKRCRKGPSFHGGHERGDPECILHGFPRDFAQGRRRVPQTKADRGSCAPGFACLTCRASRTNNRGEHPGPPHVDHYDLRLFYDTFPFPPPPPAPPPPPLRPYFKANAARSTRKPRKVLPKPAPTQRTRPTPSSTTRSTSSPTLEGKRGKLHPRLLLGEHQCGLSLALPPRGRSRNRHRALL